MGGIKTVLKPKVLLKCPNCSYEWSVYPSWATKKYCSKKCKDDSVRGKTNTLKGRKFPERRSENSPVWKGEKATYSAVHHWMYSHFGKPMKCEECFLIVKNTRKIQWANISGKYIRDRSDWKRLCTRCHRKFDGYGLKISKAHKEGRFPYKRRPPKLT